jgi:neutral trehalase
LVEPLNISGDEKEILYANLKAGAESGWDFSTRWFVLPDDNSTSTGLYLYMGHRYRT